MKNIKLIDLPSGIIYVVSVILLYIIPFVFGDTMFIFFKNYIEWFMDSFKYFSVISEMSPYKNDYKLFFSFILYCIPFCAYIHFAKPFEFNELKIMENKIKFFFVYSIFLPFFIVGGALAFLNIDHVPTTIAMNKMTLAMSESKLFLIVFFSSVVVFYSFSIAMMVSWYMNIRKYYFYNNENT